jgi:hypothetical protein
MPIKVLTSGSRYGLEFPTDGPGIYGVANYSAGPKRNYQVGGGGPDCADHMGGGSECRAQRFGKLWCASPALSPLPLIFSYKCEKSLCATGTIKRRLPGTSLCLSVPLCVCVSASVNIQRNRYRFRDPSSGLWQQGYYDDARSVAMKYALSTLPNGANGSVQGLFIWPLNGNPVSTAGWAWDALGEAVGPARPPAEF